MENTRMERPVLLRCEHLERPSGLTLPRPRLSWIPPRGEAGSVQTAYRIICSANPADIATGTGSLWDSGKVESSECHLIPYGGPALREATRIHWAVKTWNGEDSSPWSEPAHFDTGIFSPESWKASWISMAEPEYETSNVLLVEGSINSNRHIPARFYYGIYLRKEFSLREKPVRALAFFCGLGYGELEVNGTKAGDHRLDPGQTDYPLGALHSTFDITESLRPGPNAFGIILGNGRYIDAYGFGKPRAFLQVVLEYSDGERETIVSDGSWKASHGPILQNGIYSGEAYDARLEQEGWSRPGFEEGAEGSGRGWEAAETLAGPPLRPQLMEPIRKTAELLARGLSNPEPGCYVFDFGQNFAGVARLRVRGPRGARLELRFSELLDEKGRLHLGTNRESRSIDSYILKGGAEEIWEPRFTYHGFRYAELRGYPGVPTAATLTGVVLHSDVSAAGSFACSESLVNRIHSNVLWGQRSNLMSAPTDCPQRGERMGWLGDAQLASEEAMGNFDMAAFYIKYLEDIRLAQKPDGSLSDVVPPYWPLYPADPAWSAAYPALAWAMYWHYGDMDVLERHYEGIKRYVDYLDSRAEGHILYALGSYGDWCPPGTIYPKKTPMEFTSTWYLCHDTELVARMASVLGKVDEAEQYADRAKSIAEAFNRKFLLEDGRYATLKMSPIDRSAGQTTQALPLYLGIVPPEARKAAERRLVESVATNADRHIDAGIVGARYLLETLTDCGEADLAWDVVTQRSYPGWGYMIEQGATTLWERWEKLAGQGMNSHNHIMFGSVDAWFFSALGGLSPTAAGWKRVRVAPKTPGNLSHASVSRRTPRGVISASWSRSPWLSGDGASHHASSGPSGGEFRLELSIPDGVRADVEMPYADLGRELKLGGRPVWARDAEGASERAADGEHSAVKRGDVVVVELGSGDYSLVMSW
ncbi:MAG TPA: family 78 glycoside hydrolase catalytic domain [Rectinemataceae bacterium]